MAVLSADAEPFEDVLLKAAHTVHDVLGPHLSVIAYHKALDIELSSNGLCTEYKKRVPVNFQGKMVTNLHPDLIVGYGDEQFLVELKSKSISVKDYMQMKTYLTTTEIQVGYIVCFDPAFGVLVKSVTM